MSEQVQVFWDSYLKAFVIEKPNCNSSASARPIVVSPDDSLAPPTRAAAFVMDSNAPLGSFHNPIPHPSEAATTGVGHPIPASSPDSASQTPVYPPLWPRDSSAPLGTFSNPYPHGAPIPPVAAKRTPAPDQAPAVPPATNPTPSQSTAKPVWQPTAGDFDEMFNHTTPKTSSSTTPANQPVTSSPAKSNDEAGRRRILDEIIEQVMFQQSISRRTSPSPLPPPPKSQAHSQPQSPSPTTSASPSTRQVHFQDEASRAHATQAAALRAAERARQNEAEVAGFIDADEAHRLHSTSRRLPTPMPDPGGHVHQPPATSTPDPSNSHKTPRSSTSSSTESFSDTLSQPGSPIPA
ncbi:MAG: hypothetical protein Q9216_006016, partial [Gyalolechia sp. 2 TL-2023]